MTPLSNDLVFGHTTSSSFRKALKSSCSCMVLIFHAEQKPRLEYVLDVGVRMPLVLRNARLVLSSWYSSASTHIWGMFVHRPSLDRAGAL